MVAEPGDGDFRALWELCPYGILFSDPHGHISAANPAACRIFGRTEEQIIAVGRRGLIDEKDPAWIDAVRVRNRIGSYYGVLLPIPRPDGTETLVEVSSAIYTTPDGEPRTVVIIVDIDRIDRERSEMMGLLDWHSDAGEQPL